MRSGRAIVDETRIVINKKNIEDAAVDLVDLIFEEKVESDIQEFVFIAEPCQQAKKAGDGDSDDTVPCFKVRMEVSFATVITDIGDKTDDERAELQATLQAGSSSPKSDRIANKKKRKGLESHTLTLESDAFPSDRKFLIRAQLIENALTDGELGKDSVSGVRVNNVKFIVSCAQCPKVKARVDSRTQRRVAINDLRRIENIGPVLADNLRTAGIVDLDDLASVDPETTKVQGISSARLREFSVMSLLMVRFPDQIDGDSAEVLTLGLGLETLDDLPRLGAEATEEAISGALDKVEVASDFDSAGLLAFLQSRAG